MKGKTVVFFVLIFVVCFLFSVCWASGNMRPSNALKEKKVIDKYIQSYEFKNTTITSKDNLQKGFDLLFNKKPNLAGIKLVPNLKIKFNREAEFLGYVMDKYDNVFARLGTFSELSIDSGREVVFFWETAKYHFNDTYFFYVEIYSSGKYVCAFKFPVITLKIKNNNCPKGFYIVSPPLDVGPEGIRGSWLFSQYPLIAWIDTQNVGVIKYQLFTAEVLMNKDITPIEDNILPSLRKIRIKAPLVLSWDRAEGMGEGGYAFIVRAILKNNTYVDSVASNNLLIESPKKNIFVLNRYNATRSN